MQRRALIAALGGALLARPSRAQAVPPEMRLLVPFAAGGATDLLGRRLQPLLEAAGHRLVVENLPGGGSMVPMSRLAQSRPDGRTLGLGSTGLIGQIAAGEIPLRLEQFTPLVRVATDPMIIVTGAQSRFRSLDDMLAAIRTDPGPSIGSAGPAGTLGHLRLAGIIEQLRGHHTFVAYPGAARAAQELMGGHLDLAIVKPNDVFRQIRTGALRVLVVAEEERVRQMPEVPALPEAGIAPHPHGRMSPMTFVNAPAGLPPALRDGLTALLRDAVLSAEYQAKAEDDGYAADALSGDALAAAIEETLRAMRAAQRRLNA